jgi:hypothetical protein
MPEEAFQGQLSRVERNPLLMGFAALPFVGTLAFLIAGLFDPHALSGIFPTVALGWLTTYHAWQKNVWPILRSVHVRADSTSITIGERVVPRSQIRAGLLKPTGGAPRVLLRRTFGLPIELEVNKGEDGRAVLRALGLDVSQTVADFRMPSLLVTERWFGPAMLAFFMIVMGIAGALGGRLAPYAGALAFVGILAFAVLLVIPSRLRVGADGIETRWLGVRRFLPYDQMVGIVRYEKGWGNSQVKGLRVTLRSGEEVEVPIKRGRWDDDQIAVIGERILEAKDAVERGDIAVDAALLQRRERPLGEWVAALRAIGTGANATLRTAPVPRDKLMRIVEDPKQAATARAAAAVALGSELDDDGRVRLRMAAEATAAPKLRVAIEKVASGGDDAEIEAALSEVERDARVVRS